MGFYKLREWVGTVTGKGVRWGGDRLGRSAPAFLAASNTALPPSTCTARREAGQLCLRPLFLLRGRPPAGCLFLEACAGRRICRLCLPAVPCSAGCVPVHCHAHCPQQFAPVHFLLLCIVLCLPSVIPCAPGSSFRASSLLGPAVCQGQQFASCKTVPLAAATRACSGGPCTGPSILTASFSCRVHDPGPWVSVEFKLRCLL